MKNSKILIPIFVLLVLLIGGGSFFAGMKYQQSKSPRFGNFQSDRGRQFQQRFGQGFRPVNGEIISTDEKSITVKLPDGSSRIILVGDSVQINKSAPGTKDDLIKGTQVFITGSENPDGSITTQNIQINPIMPARQ